jgi:hypothetical protein
MLKKKLFNLAVDMVSKINEKSTSTMTLTSLINLGLTSRYTSYVAVDPKEQKELKESWMMMKSRDIPVQVAHGWGGAASRMRRGAPVPAMSQMGSGPSLYSALSSLTMPQMACTTFSAPPPMAMPMMSNRAPMMKSMMRSVNPVFSLDDPVPNGIEMESLCRNAPADESLSFLGGSTHRNQPQENTDDDKLMKLVSSQNFDGSFKLETSIAQLLDTTTDDITQGIFSHFSLTNKIQY